MAPFDRDNSSHNKSWLASRLKSMLPNKRNNPRATKKTATSGALQTIATDEICSIWHDYWRRKSTRWTISGKKERDARFSAAPECPRRRAKSTMQSITRNSQSHNFIETDVNWLASMSIIMPNRLVSSKLFKKTFWSTTCTRRGRLLKIVSWSIFVIVERKLRECNFWFISLQSLRERVKNKYTCSPWKVKQCF